MLKRNIVGARAPFLAVAIVVAAFVPQGASAQLWGGARTEIVLQNVTLGQGPMAYRMPRLIVRGTKLSEAELKQIFDPASTEPAQARAMRLEADEILAPEMISVVDTAGVKQKTTYRDVVLTKVGQGKIAKIVTGAGTMEGETQGQTSQGTSGRMEIVELDIGHSLAILTVKAQPSDPLKPIYKSFTLDGMKITDAKGTQTSIGRMSGGEFRARGTRDGWLATLAKMSDGVPKAPGGAAPSMEQLGKLMDGMGEMLEAFSVGTLEARDIRTAISEGGQNVVSTLSRLVYATAADGSGEFKVEGGDVTTGDVKVKYAGVALGGMRIGPMLVAFREASKNVEEFQNGVFARRLTPMFGSLRVDGIDFEGPGEDSKPLIAGGSAAKMRFALGRFELTTEKPINGIPTDIRIGIRNASIPVGANPGNAGLMRIAAMGYDRIDASFGLNLGWNEAGKELVLKDLSIDGKDMGVASIRAVVGGVGRDVFDMDTSVAMTAFLGAAARSLDISIDNRGLMERFITSEAQRQKRQPEDIRREYGTAAAIGIPAILGNSPGAKAIAQAVSRFVAKPGKLSIQAKAKQATGFGVADYMANPSPAGVFDALDVTASAE